MKDKIAIIGLGYVGLPLSVEFAKKYDVIGFDIHKERVDNLNIFKDLNHEFSDSELEIALKNINFIFPQIIIVIKVGSPTLDTILDQNFQFGNQISK